MRRNQQFALFAVCAIGFCSNAMANVTFSGKLVAPPACAINNGNNIAVNFGDIGINKVDGIANKQTLNYTIICGSSSLPWSMYLTVSAGTSSFGTFAVNTDIPGLGIQILLNGAALELGKKMPITLTNKPRLEAVPVKAAGSTLAEGDFTATATLIAHYE